VPGLRPLTESIVHDVQSSSIEADIARIESGIRQLKVQYDMFFAGGLPREPTELRTEVDRLIKRVSNLSIRKYAHRYRLNSLVSRYNAMSELWGKTMRSREEGDRPRAQSEVRRAGRHEVCHLSENGGDDIGLRRLYREFSDARRRLDPESRGIPFDRFVHGVQSQARKLRQRAGCQDVELRVEIREGSAHLKARPGRS
jgi:hypothetical protein